MDALDDPACCIYDRFFRESLPHDHAYSPDRHFGVHTNGKEWSCSDIPTVGPLHAQIPTVHTLSALFSDGYAETTFTIGIPAAATPPRTGDAAMPWLWLTY